MKILISESIAYNPQALAVLSSLGRVTALDLDLQQLHEHIPNADVLIIRLRNHIDRELLLKATQLSYIVSPTTGLDHIDLEAAKEMGISVLSLKGEQEFLSNITATAELAWGMLLSLIRHLPSAHKHVVNGGWDRNLFKGYELKGKTLGIVGFGRLGRIMGEYGKAFRMNVIAADPHVTSYPQHVTPCDLPTLLESANVISIHVPLSGETQGMFNANMFAKMKKKPIFINTSRGEIIHEAALAEALAEETVSAAGLDVLTGEIDTFPEGLKSSPLHQFARDSDRIILTPHIGGATHDSMWETELFMARKLAKAIGQ